MFDFAGLQAQHRIGANDIKFLPRVRPLPLGQSGTSHLAANALVVVTRSRPPAGANANTVSASVNDSRPSRHDRKELLAGPCQRDGRAVGETRVTAIGLQQPDLMADCGWRHAEFGGRQPEAQAARRRFKRP